MNAGTQIRKVAFIATVVALTAGLSGCVFLDRPGSTSVNAENAQVENEFSDMKDAILAVSPAIESVDVSTGISGLTRELYVTVGIVSEALTAEEIDEVLRAAYFNGGAELNRIAVTAKSIPLGNEFVDLSAPVAELGIPNVLIKSFSFSISTRTLAEHYGE